MRTSRYNTNFDNFVINLQDTIFQEVSDYLSDCVGNDDWNEELHEAHGQIMFNAIQRLHLLMNATKKNI